MTEINAYDHVVVYIWGTTGGGGRGVGHVAANIHVAGPNQDTFVSLWPGYEGNEKLTWQKNFNEVFNTEHDHGPSTVLVFYTLDVLSMLARFSTLQMQTLEWVMMPNKTESLDSESIHHNCCTAVWSVLKGGKIFGEKGILSESELKTVLSVAKVKLPMKGVSQLPQSTSKFFQASSQSKDSQNISMVASGPSTLTWEALLEGERYGPDMLYEILTKAKKNEVKKMLHADSHDARLKLKFPGHKSVFKKDGTMVTENNVGIETEAFCADILSKSSSVVKRF